MSIIVPCDCGHTFRVQDEAESRQVPCQAKLIALVGAAFLLAVGAGCGGGNPQVAPPAGQAAGQPVNPAAAPGDASTSPTILRGHQQPVKGVAMSPDRKWLASVDAGGELRLWDVQRQASVKTETVTLASGRMLPGGIVFSPNSQLLAVYSAYGSQPPSIRVWEVPEFKERWPLGNFTGDQIPIFTPDSRTIVSGSYTAQVEAARVWDLATGLPWLPDYELTSFDGQGVLYWPTTQMMERSLDTAWTVAMNVSPDGKKIVQVAIMRPNDTSNLELRVWDFLKGRLIGKVPLPDAHVFAAFDATGEKVLTVSRRATCLVEWDLALKKSVKGKPLPQVIETMVPAAVGTDHILGWSRGEKGSVTVWDVRSQQAVGTVLSPEGQSLFGNNGVPWFSPDGRRLIGITSDTKSLVLHAVGPDVERPQVAADAPSVLPPNGLLPVYRRTLGRHAAAVKSAAVSSDGSLAVTGDQTGVVNVWKTKTGELQRTLQGFQPTFLKDDRLVLVTEKLATVWDAAVEASSPLIPAPCDGVCVPTPDGRLVLMQTNYTATGAKLSVWNVADGKAVLEVPDISGMSIPCFAQDGQAVAAASLDGRSLNVWNLMNQQMTTVVKDSGLPVTGLCGVPGSSLLLASFGHPGINPYFFAIDLTTGKQIGRKSELYFGDNTTLMERPQFVLMPGNQLVATTLDYAAAEIFAIWNWTTGFPNGVATLRFTYRTDPIEPAEAIGASATGHWIVTGHKNGEVMLWGPKQ